MKTSRKSLYRQLLATGLLLSGAFQLAAPVLAAGTPAGTTISNTATATYEDPSNPGTSINATSNQVTITVAKVAGITVTADPVQDVNGGTIQTGDILNFDFTITNTGNDATAIFIPGAPSSITNGTLSGPLLADLNNDGTFETVIPAVGLTTGSIAADRVIKVRVPVVVGVTPSGTNVTVVLGNTGANDNSASTQNQPDAADGANPNEVRTIAVGGAPANGEREASATQSATVGAVPEVLNGPLNQPNAVGPTNNNDDFTNASTTVPAGLAPNAPIPDPAPRTFTNTIANGSTTDPITVSLLPTPLADPAALPNGTLVTITYNAGETATYSYNPATGFTFVSGTGTSATDPVKIPLTPASPGNTANYLVTIDLPANTPQLTGFPVPITAFNDINNNGAIDTGTEVFNTTINRLYTGFVRVVKESRILQGTGPAVVAGENAFSQTPKNPAPGNIIEYRITYTNISETAPSGSTGNVVLNASNLRIIEDGTTGGNNWALDSNSDGIIDTSNVPATAVDSTGGTVTFAPTGDVQGTTAATDVTRYEDTVAGPVTPGSAGTFTFQRRVN
ncbi:hypothetical protein [Chroococcidiopsis sp. TS-821]|uniref:hypothetical protein n=1 Tax=Chroococcidiopsis sp. TS-821 TaxID=1378066 RepID=UPI000CEDA981|nr:hypothetical protein [Chroococcidiopsis sp. TS-821]PPS43283.1 hypothetical protein B1A85_11305 [Chroococcidiopsis sp. TS-821]